MRLDVTRRSGDGFFSSHGIQMKRWLKRWPWVLLAGVVLLHVASHGWGLSSSGIAANVADDAWGCVRSAAMTSARTPQMLRMRI
jgi:hypothetical protein